MEKRIEFYLLMLTLLGMTLFLAVTKLTGLIHVFQGKEMFFSIVLVIASHREIRHGLLSEPYSSLSKARKIRLFIVSLVLLPLMLTGLLVWFCSFPA